MKRSMLHGAVATLLLGASLAASAQFSGPYAPLNWTTAHQPDITADTGSVDTSAAPGSVTLLGSDNGLNVGSQLHFTTTAAAGGTFSFNWAYKSLDADGDPVYDPAGYFHNGSFQLSVNGGTVSQSGFHSLPVNPGDVIGFWVGTTDNLGGPASLTISNFSAPIPEPGAAVLMALGLVGLTAWRTRRSF